MFNRIILVILLILLFMVGTAAITSLPNKVKIWDGTNVVDVISYEGQNSLRTTFGHKPTFMIHLNAQSISGDTAYVLIDLSGTTDWPHTDTGLIIVEWITINANPSSTFRGDIELGFLTNVDGTDGDFHEIHDLHLEKQGSEIAIAWSHTDHGLALQTSTWYGPINIDDITFQNDVLLIGPSGISSFVSGNGDMVLKITATAGDISIGIAVGYTTIN